MFLCSSKSLFKIKGMSVDEATKQLSFYMRKGGAIVKEVGMNSIHFILFVLFSSVFLQARSENTFSKLFHLQ